MFSSPYIKCTLYLRRIKKKEISLVIITSIGILFLFTFPITFALAQGYTHIATTIDNGGGEIASSFLRTKITIAQPVIGVWGNEKFVMKAGYVPILASLLSKELLLAGDFDGNGEVGFDDFFLFASAFGTKRGQAGFDPKYDLSKNGEVDFDDFFIFASNFGKIASSSKVVSSVLRY